MADARHIELHVPSGVSLGSWLDVWTLMDPVEHDGREYRVVRIESDGTILLELATSVYARSRISAVAAAERFPLYRLAVS